MKLLFTHCMGYLTFTLLIPFPTPLSGTSNCVTVSSLPGINHNTCEDLDVKRVTYVAEIMFNNIHLCFSALHGLDRQDKTYRKPMEE